MAKFGKWIGAGIGAAFTGGPIGAILGFVIGSVFDATSQPSSSQSNYYSGGSQSAGSPYRTQRPTTGGYAMSMLVLVAAVMKADGKTLKSELNYVREFFVRNFGVESANEALKILHDLLQQNIPVTDVCHQIEKNMDYSSRLQLMHFLFGIANADGEIPDVEINLLLHIGFHLGISQADVDSIKSMFIKNTDAAYKILEIEPTATDEEIKKAYRRMAMKFHPDKVSYLGEEFQKDAKEKFQKVSQAYEEIKKKRNIA